MLTARAPHIALLSQTRDFPFTNVGTNDALFILNALRIVVLRQ